MKDKQKSAGSSTAVKKRYDGFTDEEKSAMKSRVQEMKLESRRGRGKEPDLEGDVLAKIAEMPPADRAMAKRVHAIVRAAAPSLAPRLWYGMPAYYRDGKLICHFQPAVKFKTRYSTLGFSDSAHLDDGPMWPNAYALGELDADAESRITALVKKAIG